MEELKPEEKQRDRRQDREGRISGGEGKSAEERENQRRRGKISGGEGKSAEEREVLGFLGRER